MKYMHIEAHPATTINTYFTPRAHDHDVWDVTHALEALANFRVSRNHVAARSTMLEQSEVLIVRSESEFFDYNESPEPYSSPFSSTSSASSPPATSLVSQPSSNSASMKAGLAPAVVGLIVVLLFIIIVITPFFLIRCYMRGKRNRIVTQTNWRLEGQDTDLSSKADDNMVAGTANRTSSYESTYNPKEMSRQQRSFSDASFPPLPPLTFAFPQSNHNPSLISPVSTLSSKRSLARVTHNSVNIPSLPTSNHFETTATPLPYTLATIQRPFIGSLSDELSVGVGQQVGIIREYRDGWAFCAVLDKHARISGQGMLPSECLNKPSVKLEAKSFVPGT